MDEHNDTVSTPSSSNRTAGRAAFAIAVVLVFAGAAWWFGPWSADFRYGHMDLVSLKQTAARDPSNARVWRVMGLRLARDGDAAMAEPALRQAVILNPEAPDVATALGELLLATGRYPEAFQTLATVTHLHPAYAPGHMALGSLYGRKASYQHAATEFEAAARTDPGDPDAQFELAQCYVQTQQGSKARTAISAALRLAPNEPHYLTEKGVIDVAAGDIGAAIDETRRAASLAPRDAGIQAVLTNLLLTNQRGAADLDEAEKAIGRLEQLNPGYPLLPFDRGELERLRGHWEAAQRYLEKAASATPGEDRVCFALGQVYARLNQPDKARRMNDLFHRRQEVRRKLDDTRMQLGARPKDGEIYATIADLEMQIGDRAEAISVLQAGLQADPKNAKLRKWLSQLTPPSRVDGAPSQ